MNVLVNVNKETWGKVKYFATTKGLTLSSAVEELLNIAFSRKVMNLEVKK
jgi:hypothetical protein